MSQISEARPLLRISFIDSVRGIAAFLVLFQHTYEHFFPGIGKIMASQVLNFGQVGVVVFFLVSGFIIPYSLERSRSIPHFFSNRVFRIYPLYFLIIGIQFLLLAMHIRVEENGFSTSKILLSHLFFVQEYVPESSPWGLNLVVGSWTLFIEAVWYVLFAGLFVFRIPQRYIISTALVGFGLLVVASFVLDKRLPMGRMGMLYNCILGLHIYRWFKNEITDKAFYQGIAWSVAVIFTALWVSYGYHYSEHFTAFCVLLSWSLAYAIFGFFFATRNILRPALDPLLAFLGKISYSVYLSHASIMLVLIYFFGLSPLVFVATVASTIIFSAFSYAWVEKPGIDFGKRLWR